MPIDRAVMMEVMMVVGNAQQGHSSQDGYKDKHDGADGDDSARPGWRTVIQKKTARTVRASQAMVVVMASVWPLSNLSPVTAISTEIMLSEVAP